ncbi:MAG: MFS transporter [Actinobacteria bacterium]|nr:MFS transporter [Actinomycetota bacterium]
MAMVSATFLQSALAVLSAFVIGDLDLSRSEFGVLFAMFGVTGAATAPLAGRLADAWGGRRVASGLLLVAAATTVGLATSPSYGWMLAVSAAAGLALASGNPATDKLIAVHVPPRHRGSVVGFKQAGPPLGVLVAGAALPVTASALGWRPALALTVVIPALGLVGLWATLGSEPVPERRPREPLPRRSRTTMWWLAGIGFAVATGVAGVLAFLPLYGQEVLDMSPAEAGLMASVIGVVSVGARIVWGWHGARFRTVTTPLATISAVSVAATAAFWGAGGQGVWLLWIGAAMSGVSMMAWHAVGALGLIADVGAEAVGAASGVVHLGSSVGFGVGPLVFGVLADAGGYDLAWGGVLTLFVAATVATLLWRWSGHPEEALPVEALAGRAHPGSS